jgi:hypothetical protein
MRLPGDWFAGNGPLMQIIHDPGRAGPRRMSQPRSVMSICALPTAQARGGPAVCDGSDRIAHDVLKKS